MDAQHDTGWRAKSIDLVLRREKKMKERKEKKEKKKRRAGGLWWSTAAQPLTRPPCRPSQSQWLFVSVESTLVLEQIHSSTFGFVHSFFVTLSSRLVIFAASINSSAET